jgi:hypothetical protein
MGCLRLLGDTNPPLVMASSRLKYHQKKCAGFAVYGVRNASCRMVAARDAWESGDWCGVREKTKALPCHRDKEGPLPSALCLPTVPAVVVSPRPISSAVVSPDHDWRRPPHHRRGGHDHGCRVGHSRRRGSDHNWRGGDSHRQANAYRDLDSCMCGQWQRQSGSRQACQERTHPEPAMLVWHSVLLLHCLLN